MFYTHAKAPAFMNRLSAFYLAAAVFTLTACTGQRKADEAEAATTAAVSTTPVSYVSLSQGACFGTCPVFTLNVDKSGAATYTGQQFAPYKGLHTGQLDPDTLAKLMALAQVVLAKADSLPREIKTGITDYSQSTVRIASGTDTITFTGTTAFAAGVDEIRELLYASVEQTKFTRDPSAAAPLPNQLRIVLKSADQIQVVQEDYFKQQFRVERMLSQKPPTFLVNFDPYVMSAEEMIRSLEGQAFVVSAEVYEIEPDIAD